jgi:hypothetical protein
MVRVLVIADEEAPNLHVQALRDLSPDLVLSAGDLPWHYVEYVASSVDVPVVFVPPRPGDPPGEAEPQRHLHL